MTAFLERGPIEEHDATASGGAGVPGRTSSRRCTVLECASADGGVALLYVFYRDAPAWRGGTRQPPRIPGKQWRHAVGLRAGDRLQLDGGETVVIDKLVAAPSLRDIGAFRPTRIRTYWRAPDGSWA